MKAMMGGGRGGGCDRMGIMRWRGSDAGETWYGVFEGKDRMR